jgi:acyl-coenzyme A thioesterase PaaI-like protein
MTDLTPRDIEALIRRNLPVVDHHGEVVEAVTSESLRLRLPFDETFAGDETWGESDLRVFSGPMVMALADTAMYACCLAGFGPEVIPVMQSYTINFLRPALATDPRRASFAGASARAIWNAG